LPIELLGLPDVEIKDIKFTSSKEFIIHVEGTKKEIPALHHFLYNSLASSHKKSNLLLKTYT
jgi:hypothetical protein